MWSVNNLTPVVFPESGSSGSNPNADYMEEEEELFKDIQRMGIVSKVGLHIIYLYAHRKYDDSLL